MTSQDQVKEEKIYADFDTSLGTFTALLYTAKAPVTTENFINLAEGTKAFLDPQTGKYVSKPLYDGRHIFRIIKGFMMQTGSANDTGRYSSGFTIKDEYHPDLTFNKAGLLAMANAGPNTGSCQFFITFSAEGCRHLNGRHPVFGQVVEGMETIRKIENVPVGGPEGSAPVDPPIIKKVTIRREPAE